MVFLHHRTSPQRSPYKCGGRFSKKHVKVSKYVSYNFVIGGPNHPPSPSSFAVLQNDKDYGGQANAPTFAGLRRGKRIIGMAKLSIEEQDHEFEGASHPRSSFGVRRCPAAFEEPSQIENRCSPALIWSLLSHARPCNALAPRAKASTFGKWRLFGARISKRIIFYLAPRPLAHLSLGQRPR